MLGRGELPLRVTHNDTKINNVLFRKDSDEPIVVIDLDTVMPGLVGHDFGDAIRFAANFVREDSPEYEKAGVNLEVFRAFAEGFLSMTAHTLTENEIATMALSCFVLTVELSTRFLADYIDGDLYFKTFSADHNLVRTRCQIALAKDMLRKLPQMEQIVRDCVAAVRN
jgi:N-acetylhexosamine 1-kinase